MCLFFLMHNRKNIPSELDSDVLFFSSPSTGVNSSELEDTKKAFMCAHKPHFNKSGPESQNNVPLKENS